MTKELLKEKITKNEIKEYLDKEYTVPVPDNVESLHFYIQSSENLWITCMVYDEYNNLRGQLLKSGESGRFVIHENSSRSSPYTIAGPIGSGEWTINLNILDENESQGQKDCCTLTILSDYNDKQRDNTDTLVWVREDVTSFDLDLFDPKEDFQSVKKWYKGDFHTHTIYSDGDMSREENLTMSRKQSLDFFVATDHNIVPVSWRNKSDVLIIPGTEITSTLGHFNIINPDTSPFVKNRVHDIYNESGTNEIIARDYGNALISINHPFLKGCPWIYKETSLSNVDSIEIINDPTYPDNPEATEQALLVWNEILNHGYHITGIGGSDSHMRPENYYEGSTEPSLIGDPGTFVFCDGLSAHNVIQGVRNGHVTVSRGNFINLTDGNCIPGETSSITKGELYSNVNTDDDITMEWVVDGVISKTEKTNTYSFAFDFRENDYHWIRVDVRYSNGELYGFTNPIYFGEKQLKQVKWGELIQR